MNEATNFHGLFCEINLPLEWIPVAESTAISPSLDRANQNCLRIILGLDDVVHETADDAVDLSHDLQRLDFKVNILLELVAQLVTQNVHLPPSTELKLGPGVLQWLSVDAPTTGQTVQVKLYPDQRFPSPLVLSGTVVDVSAVGNRHQVQLEFDQQPELTQELLEKYIFRCHRRHIARMKSQSGKEN